MLSKPYINSAILEKQINLPKKYIQRFRNEHGVFPKNVDINIDEFIEVYDRLKSSDLVAEYFQVSDSYIVKFAKEIGYKNDSYIIPDDIIKNVIIDYENGIENEEIFDKYKISQTSLYRILKRNNIKPNKSKEKFDINKNIFDIIDNNEKSYLLGFIAADGSINNHATRLTISIKRKDVEILEIFRKFLQTNKSIEYFSRIHEGKTYEYARLSIINKHINKALNSLGLHERKTWGNTIPEIDNEYMRGFIRGYFDGDGCITNLKYKSISVSIAGFKSNMTKIISFLESINIFTSFTIDKRTSSRHDDDFGSLVATNNLQKYCFLKWIYENDNGIHLNRKYLKAMQFISDIENSNDIKDKQIVIYYKYAVCGVS